MNCPPSFTIASVSFIEIDFVLNSQAVLKAFGDEQKGK
jgi:hypothetical protein